MDFQDFQDFKELLERNKKVKYTECLKCIFDEEVFHRHILIGKRPFSVIVGSCKYISPWDWAGREPILSFGDGEFKIGVGDLTQTILKEAKFEVLTARGPSFGPLLPILYGAHMGNRVFVEYSIGMGATPEYHAKIRGDRGREIIYRTGDVQLLLDFIIHTTRDMWIGS